MNVAAVRPFAGFAARHERIRRNLLGRLTVGTRQIEHDLVSPATCDVTVVAIGRHADLEILRVQHALGRALGRSNPKRQHRSNRPRSGARRCFRDT